MSTNNLILTNDISPIGVPNNFLSSDINLSSDILPSRARIHIHGCDFEYRGVEKAWVPGYDIKSAYLNNDKEKKSGRSFELFLEDENDNYMMVIPNAALSKTFSQNGSGLCSKACVLSWIAKMAGTGYLDETELVDLYDEVVRSNGIEDNPDLKDILIDIPKDITGTRGIKNFSFELDRLYIQNQKNGIYKDGNFYRYYVEGRPTLAGVVKHAGHYCLIRDFAEDGYHTVTSSTVEISLFESHNLIPPGNYEINSDGFIVDLSCNMEELSSNNRFNDVNFWCAFSRKTYNYTFYESYISSFNNKIVKYADKIPYPGLPNNHYTETYSIDWMYSYGRIYYDWGDSNGSLHVNKERTDFENVYYAGMSIDESVYAQYMFRSPIIHNIVLKAPNSSGVETTRTIKYCSNTIHQARCVETPIGVRYCFLEYVDGEIVLYYLNDDGDKIDIGSSQVTFTNYKLKDIEWDLYYGDIPGYAVENKREFVDLDITNPDRRQIAYVDDRDDPEEKYGLIYLSSGDDYEAPNPVVENCYFDSWYRDSDCTDNLGITKNENYSLIKDAGGSVMSNIYGLIYPKYGVKFDTNSPDTLLSPSVELDNPADIVVSDYRFASFDQEENLATFVYGDRLKFYDGDAEYYSISASCPGYLFDGWYTSSEGGTKITDVESISNNITLYAHWVFAPTVKIRSYILENNILSEMSDFDIDGIDELDSTWGYDETTRTITLSDYNYLSSDILEVKSLRAIQKWSTSDEIVEWYFADDTGDPLDISSMDDIEEYYGDYIRNNIYLVAVMQYKPRLILNPNDGLLNVSSTDGFDYDASLNTAFYISFYHGEEIVADELFEEISSNISITRDGYKFTGWETSDDPLGYLMPGDSYSLEAGWSENVVITFRVVDTNNAPVLNGAKIYAFGEEVDTYISDGCLSYDLTTYQDADTIYLEDYTSSRDYYSFSGWVDSLGNDVVSISPEDITDTMYVYTDWNLAYANINVYTKESGTLLGSLNNAIYCDRDNGYNVYNFSPAAIKSVANNSENAPELTITVSSVYVNHDTQITETPTADGTIYSDINATKSLSQLSGSNLVSALKNGEFSVFTGFNIKKSDIEDMISDVSNINAFKCQDSSGNSLYPSIYFKKWKLVNEETGLEILSDKTYGISGDSIITCIAGFEYKLHVLVPFSSVDVTYDGIKYPNCFIDIEDARPNGWTKLPINADTGKYIRSRGVSYDGNIEFSVPKLKFFTNSLNDSDEILSAQTYTIVKKRRNIGNSTSPATSAAENSGLDNRCDYYIGANVTSSSDNLTIVKDSRVFWIAKNSDYFYGDIVKYSSVDFETQSNVYMYAALPYVLAYNSVIYQDGNYGHLSGVDGISSTSDINDKYLLRDMRITKQDGSDCVGGEITESGIYSNDQIGSSHAVKYRGYTDENGNLNITLIYLPKYYIKTIYNGTGEAMHFYYSGARSSSSVRDGSSWTVESSIPVYAGLKIAIKNGSFVSGDLKTNSPTLNYLPWGNKSLFGKYTFERICLDSSGSAVLVRAHYSGDTMTSVDGGNAGSVPYFPTKIGGVKTTPGGNYTVYAKDSIKL